MERLPALGGVVPDLDPETAGHVLGRKRRRLSLSECLLEVVLATNPLKRVLRLSDPDDGEAIGAKSGGRSVRGCVLILDLL